MKAGLGTKGDLWENAGTALEVGEVRDGATEAGYKVGVGKVEALDCGDVVDKVLAQELLLGTPDAIFSLIQESVLVWVTMFLISTSGEVKEADGIGLMTGGGRRYSNWGGESKDWGLGCLLLDEYGGGGSRGWGGGWYGGNRGNDNGRREFLFWDVIVWVQYLVPKGCLGGDVEGIRVLELGLGLLDVGVERLFILLVQDFAGGMDKVVEGDFDKDVAKGGIWRGLED